jgi:hypothetical protein
MNRGTTNPAALLAFLLAATTASAAAPSVTSTFPPGARRGTSVEVRLAGSFAPWPVRAWSATKGIDVRPGKTAGILQVKVGEHVAPGTHWLRLYNDDGASRPFPFLVGTLPEVEDKEPNDEPKRPQRLDGDRATVNGRLSKNGDVDHFALRLRKGQTLVASLTANQVLGSPMDGVLQVVTPEGFVLGENHDDRGLDPQLAFAVPRDGEYLVRVFAFPATPDSSIRLAGGEAFLYRLTLTAGGFADHAFPLAVSQGPRTPVRLFGWNLDKGAEAHVEPDPLADSWPVTAATVANAVTVRVEPHAVVMEQEAKAPQQVALPATVSGRIDPPGDVDVYRVAVRKGKKLTFRVEARSLGSPLDPVLRLTDAAGKLLQEQDDTRESADPELSLTPNADGAMHVEVRDLHGAGGWRFAYRLRMLTAEPDFALTVAADSFVGKADGSLDVPVTVVRTEGFNGPVEVKLEGLPPGTEVAPAPAMAAPGAKSLTLKVRTTQPFSGPVRIVGSAAGRSRLARPTGRGPAAEIDTVWLTLCAGKR